MNANGKQGCIVYMLMIFSTLTLIVPYLHRYQTVVVYNKLLC